MSPRTHVFLTGFPRSGTTLLEQALAGRPDVEVLAEREPLIDAIRAYLDGPAGLDRLADASEAELDGFRESYWRIARREGAKPDCQVFIDKQPFNTLKLPLIVRLFPDAKILFARRDPRDVVLSCFRRRFLLSAPTYEFLTLQGAAALYDAAMRLAARLDEIAGMDLRVVAHEELVAGFDRELQRVCGWLGLDWSKSMRQFPERVRENAVATPSGAQLARGLNADGVGHWRRYRQQMSAVLPLLAPWVERFGYGDEIEGPDPHAPRPRRAEDAASA